MKCMARPKRPDKEYLQLGWRLDGIDKPLLKDLEDFMREHRISRNSAITLAVEKMIKEWKNTKPN